MAFFRKKPKDEEPEELFEEISEETDPAEDTHKATSPKAALLKAYYSATGRSDEEIEELLAQKESVEPTTLPLEEDMAPYTAVPEEEEEEEPAPTPPVPDELSSQVGKIGQLVGQTAVEMEKKSLELRRDLRDGLSGMEQKLKEIEEHVTENLLSDQKDDLVFMENRLEKLKEQVESTVASDQMKESALAKMQKHLKEIEEQTKASSTPQGVSAEDLAKIREEMAALREENEKSAARLEEMVADHMRRDFSEDLGRMEQRMKELEEHVAGIQPGVPAPPVDMTQLDEKIARLREAVKARIQLGEKIAEGLPERFEKDLERMEERMKKLEGNVTEYETEKLVSDEDFALIDKKIARLREAVKAKTGEETRVPVELDREIREDLSAMQQKMQQLEERVEDAVATDAASRDDLSEVRNEVRRLETTLNEATSGLREEVSRSILENVDTEIAGIERKMKDLEDRLMVSKAAAPEPSAVDEATVSEIQEEITHLREITAQSRLELEKRIRVTERAGQRVASGIDEVRQFAARGKAEIEQEIEKLREETQNARKDLEGRLGMVRSDGRDVTTRIKRMRNDIVMDQGRIEDQIEELKGLIGESKSEFEGSMRKVQEATELRRMEMRDSLKELESKLETSSRQVGITEEAAARISQLESEIAGLRQESVKARHELEEMISVFLDDEKDPIARLTQVKEYVSGTQALLESRLEEIKKLSGQSRADLEGMIKKLREETEQRRIATGGWLQELGARVDTVTEQMETGEAAALLASKLDENLENLVEESARARTELEEQIKNVVAGTRSELEDRIRRAEDKEETTAAEVSGLEKFIVRNQAQFEGDLDEFKASAEEARSELVRMVRHLSDDAEEKKNEIAAQIQEIWKQLEESALQAKRTEEVSGLVSKLQTEISGLREDAEKDRRKLVDEINRDAGELRVEAAQRRAELEKEIEGLRERSSDEDVALRSTIAELSTEAARSKTAIEKKIEGLRETSANQDATVRKMIAELTGETAKGKTEIEKKIEGVKGTAGSASEERRQIRETAARSSAELAGQIKKLREQSTEEDAALRGTIAELSAEEARNRMEIEEKIEGLREASAKQDAVAREMIAELSNETAKNRTELEKKIEGLGEQSASQDANVRKVIEALNADTARSRAELKKNIESVETAAGSASEERRQIRQTAARSRAELEARLKELKKLAAQHEAGLREMVEELRNETVAEISRTDERLENLKQGAKAAASERREARDTAARNRARFEGQIEELRKLSGESRTDLEQTIGRLRKESEESRVETGGTIENLQSQIETLSKRAETGETASEGVSQLQEQVASLREGFEDRARGLEVSGERTVQELRETKDIIAGGHEHFNEQLNNLTKAIEGLRKTMEENRTDLNLTIGKLRDEVENVQVELEIQEQASLARDEAEETRRDFDVSLVSLGKGPRASHPGISVLRDEMNRLRGKAAWLRQQLENGIGNRQ